MPDNDIKDKAAMCNTGETEHLLSLYADTESETVQLTITQQNWAYSIY